MEIVLYYILPNVMLFGGIFVFCKATEIWFQYIIDNYETLKTVK